MATLSDRLYALVQEAGDEGELLEALDSMFSEAAADEPRSGVLAFMRHDGIGVEKDLDVCFELAERAAFSEDDALGYYLLGFMCDNAETPDQLTGGPRQKYHHYDAERFYEICASKESPWRIPACLWLGDHFLDSARGGDPEIGVEYLESIADVSEDAAERLRLFTT